MIYFLQDSGTCEIKIGIATDPRTRAASLQIGNPRELVLLGWMHYDECGDDETFEAKLHERFAHARVRGEWFKPCPELLRFLIDGGIRVEVPI